MPIAADRPPIVSHLIPFPKKRVDETRAYSVRHYGRKTALLKVGG